MDTDSLSYEDASSVLHALLGYRVYGAGDVYFNQSFGSWSSCQPNNLSVEWAFYNPFNVMQSFSMIG